MQLFSPLYDHTLHGARSEDSVVRFSNSSNHFQAPYFRQVVRVAANAMATTSEIRLTPTL